MLAVVFGYMRYHYLHNCKFTCQSDHKLLEDIHLNHIRDTPPGFPRLILKNQPYDSVNNNDPGYQDTSC